MKKYTYTLLFCSVIQITYTQNINTIAGTGEINYCCDGGPANLSQIYSPHGIVKDASGNIYFADGGNHRIRKINSVGNISTIAGTGVAGYSGDGGPANLAQINGPTSMALDPAGNIYFSDSYNNRIRKINPSGVITTIAGIGTSTFSGDGGQATSAGLNQPRGILWQSDGSIYFSDAYNHRVRKIDPSGVITTVAGNGTSGYSGDGSLAINAQLNIPNSLVIDANGNLIFCESSNHCIRKVSPAGIISTICGNGSQGSSGDGGSAQFALLSSPIGLVIDPTGVLYFSDCNNNRIRTIDLNGIITTFCGNGNLGLSGDGGPATSANLYYPKGLALDATNTLYFADNGNNRIRKVTSGIISAIAGNASTAMHGIPGLAVNAQVGSVESIAIKGTKIFLVDQTFRIKVIESGSISIFAGNGNPSYSGDNGQAINAGMYPNRITLDAAGNLYVSDYGNGRIRKITPSGIITTIAGNGNFGYTGDGGQALSAALALSGDIKVNSNGDVFFVDQSNSLIRKISNGIITTYAGSTLTTIYNGEGIPATSAGINPANLLFNQAGELIFTDPGNSRIRKISSNGIITTIAGNGAFVTAGDGGLATQASLNNPRGLTIDFAGNLYCTDGFSSIRKIGTDGIIFTVAGSSVSAFSGDGGPAVNAQLWNVNSLSTDATGNLYEGEYNRLRAICFNNNCLQVVSELEANSNEIMIYPNPFNDKITISDSERKEGIKILNSFGQDLGTANMNEKGEIDLSSFQQGVYFIKLRNKIYKMVKQ